MLIKQVVLPMDMWSTKNKTNKQKLPRDSKLCHVLVIVKKKKKKHKCSKDMKPTWRKLKIMWHDNKEMWMNSFAFIWRMNSQWTQLLNHCSSEAWVSFMFASTFLKRSGQQSPVRIFCSILVGILVPTSSFPLESAFSQASLPSSLLYFIMETGIATLNLILFSGIKNISQEQGHK